MGHCRHDLAIVVGVGADGSVPHQTLTGERVFAVGKMSKAFRLDLSAQTPFLCERAVPVAADRVLGAVIVLTGVGEVLLVIALCLAGTEWFRNGQHGATQ